MIEYQTYNVPVEFGKGTAKAKAFSKIKLILISDKTRVVTISDMYYVPEIRANLLLTEKLREKGLFYRNDKQILFINNGIVQANVYPY